MIDDVNKQLVKDMISDAFVWTIESAAWLNDQCSLASDNDNELAIKMRAAADSLLDISKHIEKRCEFNRSRV